MKAATMRRKNLTPCRHGGFTLVEMMVALTIGLFLVIGLISLLVSTSQSRTELDKTSRQIENGRYASQLLTEDIQHAGFLGNYFPAPATVTYIATPPLDPCAPAAGDFDNTATAPKVPVFVYGYDGTAADPSCVTNRIAGTGVLVVRRVSTTAVAAPVAGETYFQSAACPPITTPFVVSSTAAAFTLQQKDCATAAPLRKYIVRVYYVSSCNVCAPSDGLPTLKMAEFVGGAMTVTPLVEGIENLQVDYGIDMDGNGSPDCYVSNPTNPAAAQIASTVCPQPSPAYVWTDATTNWSNVVTVRAYVLARNNEASGDWDDSGRTYDMGLAGTVSPGGKYRRHVYSALARVTNVAGRRELP